jgi:hypothetical protein
MLPGATYRAGKVDGFTFDIEGIRNETSALEFRELET